MKATRRKADSRDVPKIILLMSLLLGVFFASSAVLTMYPQHMFIDEKTVVDAIVGFGKGDTVNIRGNMVQYSAGDRIPLSGREYIFVTANQVQIGGSTYREGIRTITASMTQNVLFEQEVGEFVVGQRAQVGIDDHIIALSPVLEGILAVQTRESNYNVALVEDTAYIKEGDIMLRLQRQGTGIKIYLVGFQGYSSIWMRKV